MRNRIVMTAQFISCLTKGILISSRNGESLIREEYMLSVVSKVVIYFLVTSICIENMRLINNIYTYIKHF